MRGCDCGSYAVNIDPDRILCDVCLYKIPLTTILDKLELSADPDELRESTNQLLKIVTGRTYVVKKVTNMDKK